MHDKECHKRVVRATRRYVNVCGDGGFVDDVNVACMGSKGQPGTACFPVRTYSESEHELPGPSGHG
jgi:hypothetical protein